MSPSASSQGRPTDAALHRACRRLARACLVLAVAIPAAAAAGLWLADPATLMHRAGLSSDLPVAPVQWALAGGLGLLSPLVLATALLQARRCFRHFAGGSPFTQDAVRAFRRFAAWIAAACAVGLITPTLLSLVLSLGAAPGARSLVIRLDSHVLLGLLVAGLVWAFAAVLARATALADDHAQIV